VKPAGALPTEGSLLQTFSQVVRQVSGLRVDYPRESIKSMISLAYGIDARLIVGPDWVNRGEDSFEIKAVMPAGSTQADLPAMFKALLDERFHLTVHQIVADQNGYALVVGKKGHKLKPGRDMQESDCNGTKWETGLGGSSVCRMSYVVGVQTVNTRLTTSGPNGPMLSRTAGTEQHLEYYRITMPKLISLISALISGANTGGIGPTTPFLPVIDKTGLSGEWGAFLDIEHVGDDRLASVSDSLGKQGLSLERITVPTVKLVIDRVDKIPVEN